VNRTRPADGGLVAFPVTWIVRRQSAKPFGPLNGGATCAGAGCRLAACGTFEPSPKPMSMKRQDYLQIGTVSNKDEFTAQLIAFAHKLDFGLATAAVAIDASDTSPYFEMVGNTPQQYQQTARDPEVSKRDPLLARMKRTGVPFAWDQSTYVKAGAADLWETQAHFGYKTGIAMAMHLPNGRHFLVGIDREAPLPADDEKQMRLLADFQLFATHAQEVAIRLLEPASAQLVAVATMTELTTREREVLKWAAQGKTTWETSKILELSQHTITKHLDAAIKRFGCVSKTQAVAEAVRRRDI
jgi:DNA-binding CsgD family transcriptional regulator